MHWIIIALITSYLLGSVPTAYLFGRLLRGIDIRKHGSGNVGATNALRVLGKGPGIAVLGLDILKGLAAVLILGKVFGPKIPGLSTEALSVLLGMGCIIGHNWTVFLQFKGGKGIATSLGVLIGLATNLQGLRIVLGAVIVTWFIVFLLARIVSLASILSAIFLPVYMFLFRQPGILLFSSLILSFFVILRHKSNLNRLFQGKEPRLNFRK
jgi:glycerol-3-phosphate acyltransferase PlsY